MAVDYKCLYVKKLNRSTTSDDLRPLFEETGPVITVKKLSPTTAIVSYTDADHAQFAIESFDGFNLHGSFICVELKKKKNYHHVGSGQGQHFPPRNFRATSETLQVDLHILRYISACYNAKRLLSGLRANTSIDLDNATISIHGDGESVREASTEIEKLKSSLSTFSHRLSNVFRQCFQQITPTGIVEVFKSNRIIAGWDMHAGQLHTCSNSLQSARRSLELIQDMIVESEYPTDKALSSEQISLTADPKWIALKERLKTEHTTTSFEIQYNHSLRKIIFAGRSDENSNAVILALEEFFEPASNREDKISMNEETAQLVLKNKEYILQQCCEEGVTLDLDRVLASGTCTVKYSSDAMFDALIVKLNSIIKHCARKAVSFSKLGSVEWLKSPFGQNKLADITSLTRTLSTTTAQKVQQKSKAHPPSSIWDKLKACVLLQEKNNAKPDTHDRVKLVRGDISAIDVEGLVSCNGRVANTISRKYRVSLQQGRQCSRNLGSNLFIYHMNLYKWCEVDEVSLLETLHSQVLAAFQELGTMGAKTIAIPAIGTGSLLGYPPEVVASIVVGTAMGVLEKCPIQKIYVVIHPQAAIHKVFEDEFDKYKPKPAPQTVFSPAVTDVVVEKLTITFTGLKETDVTTAVSKLQEEIQHGIASTRWGDLPSDKAVIMKLTGDEVCRIRTQARKNHVDAEVEVSKGTIVLEGIKDHVNSTRDFVNSVLRGKSSTVSHNAFPSHWDQRALAKGQHEVKLDRYSEEFSRVSCKFFETCQIIGLQISETTRIQNEHLYTQYEAQKSKIKRELSGDKTMEIERQLWHGTTAESVKQICANEFNRSFAGAHGMSYGQGSYFSTSSEYSVRYSEGQVDRYMILAKVATGRYQRGSRDTQRKNLPAGIHSTVNSQSNPTIFVVYHDASAYPEYVIKFTKKVQLFRLH